MTAGMKAALKRIGLFEPARGIYQFLRGQGKSALLGLGFYGPIARTMERIQLGGRTPMKTDESGLPVPDMHLINLVFGLPDQKMFLAEGESHAALMAETLARHGASLDASARILDFGCGCGRIVRYLPRHVKAEIHGTDYNKDLIGWCAANLPHRFAVNKLEPPLGYPDDFFDCIYSISVLTHLREATQFLWLAELKRVLKPGGLLLVTLHDEFHRNATPYHDRIVRDGFFLLNTAGEPANASARFRDTARGEESSAFDAMLRKNALEGSNVVAAFHSRDYIRREFSKTFKIVDVLPATDRFTQAIVLLRKPSDRAP